MTEEMESGKEQCDPRRGRRWQGDFILVSYFDSRIGDPDEFHRCLRQKLEASFIREDGLSIDIKVFGSQNVTEQGRVDYCVLLKFDGIIHCHDVEDKLTVYIGQGAERVPDTSRIFFRLRMENMRNLGCRRYVKEHLLPYAGRFATEFGERMDPETISETQCLQEARTLRSKMCGFERTCIRCTMQCNICQKWREEGAFEFT